MEISSMDILLVDDNQKVREDLYLKLVSAGHNVTQAENGLVALACFKTNTYDAVISDFKMPIMDGLKLSQNIMAEYNFPANQIIILTTDSGIAFTAKADKLKLSWLSKPINFALLESKLDHRQIEAA